MGRELQERRAVRKISRRRSAGFTLVEVMMAMFIVLVSLLGLLQVVGMTTSKNLNNQLRDEAVLIGEDQMADLMRRPEAALPVFEALSAPGRLRGASRKYFITRRAGHLTTGSYQLSVRVAWSYKNITSFHEVKSMRTYVDGK